MEGEREGAKERRRKGGCEAKEEEREELLPPSGSPRSFMGAAVALRSIT